MLPTKIIGFAIVSDDGMLADADGVMPDALKIPGDQRFFEDGMDVVQVAIHGRHSHEMQPHSPRRHRIYVTSTVASLSRHDTDATAILWNPQGASFEDAWTYLNVPGALGVVGGTSVFDMFLDRYDTFYLSRAGGVALPGGVPVFGDVPRETPEQILARHGYTPGASKILDAFRNASLVSWRRT